jgi:elongation factor Ts
MATAQKRSGRDTKEGVVQSYIHMGGKIGVLVEVNCESDFVAKNDDFVQFAKDIAMHIAAANPIALNPEDVSEEIIEKEKEIYRGQARELGKPENMLDKIAEGKLKKYFKENCLMNQVYVKDPSISISDYLGDTIGKIGENIRISRFARFQLGE